MKKWNDLASAVAKREGKKSVVSVGDVREVLRILVDLEAEHALQSDYNDFQKFPYQERPSTMLSTAASKRNKQRLVAGGLIKGEK